MQLRKYLSENLLILFCVFLPLSSIGQSDSLTVKIHTEAAFGTNGVLPHWLVFNRFGFFESNKAGAFVRGEITRQWRLKNGLTITSELDALGGTADILLHEAHLNFDFKGFSLQMGLNEVQNSNFPDHLSTGHLFLSQNARSIPKISAGFFDYVDVPLTKGYLQIKGVLSQGILEKDRVVERPLYHEKWGYLRTRQLPVNVHFGFSNVALFGGELNGVRQSTNYLEVFLGRASSTSNVNGDAINAAGAHFGIFDYGAEIATDDLSINVYYQQPWEDRTSLKNFSAGNKDYLIGIHLTFNNQKWIQEILYENLNSTHQSGEGLPDPIVNGIGYSFVDLRPLDYDQFLFDELGIVTSGISFNEFIEIIRFETNNNLEFGGRDSYYVNRGYPDGNTFHGHVIGNPLFLTASRLFDLTGYSALDASTVVNNRIRAQHFGIAGNLVPWDIDYRLLLTFTQNLGTYAGKYGGNITSWNLDRNYLFRNGINSDYLMLELRKDLDKVPIQARLTLAHDQRGFGKFSGAMLGLTYTIK